jgi:hypothetical protein
MAGKSDWEKDLVNIRVSNIERKEALDFNVNGRHFHLENNSVNRVPRAVFFALEDAIQHEHHIAGDIDKGRVVETTESPRVMSQILTDDQAEKYIDTKGKKERRVIEDITGDAEPKKAFSKKDIKKKDIAEEIEAAEDSELE